MNGGVKTEKYYVIMVHFRERMRFNSSIIKTKFSPTLNAFRVHNLDVYPFRRKTRKIYKGKKE